MALGQTSRCSRTKGRVDLDAALVVATRIAKIQLGSPSEALPRPALHPPSVPPARAAGAPKGGAIMAATSNAIRRLFLALNSFLYSFYSYPNSKASLNASPCLACATVKLIFLLRNATRNTVFESLDKHWPNTVKKDYMVLSNWHGSANTLNPAAGISGLA